MPKVPHLAPDGSYLGLIDRDDPPDAVSAPRSASAGSSLADVTTMKYGDLRSEAKERGVPNYSHMKRPVLEAAVQIAREEF